MLTVFNICLLIEQFARLFNCELSWIIGISVASRGQSLVILNDWLKEWLSDLTMYWIIHYFETACNYIIDCTVSWLNTDENEQSCNNVVTDVCTTEILTSVFLATSTIIVKLFVLRCLSCMMWCRSGMPCRLLCLRWCRGLLLSRSCMSKVKLTDLTAGQCGCSQS